MKTLFELNPALDLPAYAARFAATGRVQLRDVLTPESASELQIVLARGTEWGIAIGAGTEKPASIRAGRLLTGADLDIESVRQFKNGLLWFCVEFGCFIVKTDATGRVLRREVPLPGVQAPQNPYLGTGTPNLGGSGGFEGMAINPQGDRLYTLLEKSVTGDPAGSLRINEFHIDTEAYTDQQWLYRLDTSGTAIGDMVAINDHEFIVIERNGATATSGTAAGAGRAWWSAAIRSSLARPSWASARPSSSVWARACSGSIRRASSASAAAACIRRWWSDASPTRIVRINGTPLRDEGPLYPGRHGLGTPAEQKL